MDSGDISSEISAEISSSQRDPYMNILQELGISAEISQEISPESTNIQSHEKFHSAKLDVKHIKNC